ncbi:MAG TPA: hypothetical protein VHV51_04880 [Polyangiaceae bacterium]|nr:hypothetical protein [Polyangiaceae bacterium]
MMRRSAASRPDLVDASRWKVRLELAPAEIAFVYRKGLARGAEVCRRGTHEWRPLVTTPELREALAKRASLAEMIELAPPAPASITLSQTLAFNDPALAALFLARRPQLPKSTPPPPPRAKSAPPPPLLPKSTRPPALLSDAIPRPPRLPQSEPPPPLVFTTDAAPALERAALVRSDSIPDWEDTPVVPMQFKTLPPAAIERAPKLAPAARKIVHARPFELSAVAACAVVGTLAITALTWRAEALNPSPLISSRAHAGASAPSPAPASHVEAAAPISTIPVVVLRDLPLEAKAALGSGFLARTANAPQSTYAASAPDAKPSRASLVRALNGAAAAARSCGDGPVSAEVVVTFGPSGVARGVHFSAPPRVALRSCVLNAVARSRVAPFVGEPVTVSKTLRW